MLLFDNIRFRSYLKDIKGALNSVLKYRSNFYCMLCDIHQQKFFNIVTQEIMFSEQFCFDMIDKNKVLLKFLNIYLIEYFDVLLNMMNCYDSDAKPIF